MSFFVYILANRRNGTIYVGATDNLQRRIFEHKTKVVDGFTKENGIDRLVYFDVAETREAAMLREKQLKKWNRSWKLRLIEEQNPGWRDLSETI